MSEHFPDFLGFCKCAKIYMIVVLLLLRAYKLLDILIMNELLYSFIKLKVATKISKMCKQ